MAMIDFQAAFATAEHDIENSKGVRQTELNLAGALLYCRELLSRVEPELVPNYDLAEDLRKSFGLGGRPPLIEDIRFVLDRRLPPPPPVPLKPRVEQ